MKRLFKLLLLLVGLCHSYADAVGYGGKHEIEVKTETAAFRHVHDWDSRKVDTLFSDLAHHEKFFTPANDFAFVEARDSKGVVLFRSPSPALTKLWISPDAQFFVGLSSIKLRNPYQLVIWQRDGTLLHREHISAEVAKLSAKQRLEFARRFPKAEKFLAARYFMHGGETYLDYSILGMPNQIGSAAFSYLFPFRVRHPYSDDFAESVTNVIEWFDSQHPGLSIDRIAGELTISLRSPKGRQMNIPLKK